MGGLQKGESQFNQPDKLKSALTTLYETQHLLRVETEFLNIMATTSCLWGGGIINK